ncbi:CBS domain-containing protein [Streptomyces sp. NPDC056061]|uniref:CBS domain-containing protein n=1 Tax=Streptomyces sp. NPDC056061 TaxID=3345700 RepID=UPI0035DD9B56
MPFVQYTVDDVMTRNVITVSPSAEFREIVAVMERWKVTAVPVVDGDGRVVGIVSEADLLPKEEFHEHLIGLIEQMEHLGDSAKAGSVRAEELMTRPVISARPGMLLPHAARLMAVHRVKSLPVVDDDGALRGIVSRADLLKVFLRPDDVLAAEVRREVVDRLFPSPSSSVKVDVTHGVVTLTGRVHDTTLLPAAIRLARSVEGVVDVECRIGRHHACGEARRARDPLPHPGDMWRI